MTGGSLSVRLAQLGTRLGSRPPINESQESFRSALGPGAFLSGRLASSPSFQGVPQDFEAGLQAGCCAYLVSHQSDCIIDSGSQTSSGIPNLTSFALRNLQQQGSQTGSGIPKDYLPSGQWFSVNQ